MAIKNPASKRVHKLAVRVVDSPRPVMSVNSDRVSSGPVARPANRPATATLDRQTRVRIAWIGTIVVVIAIIIGWMAVVGNQLAKPGEPNSLWLKIRANLSALFSGKSGPTDQSATEKQFDQTSKRLFPNL